MREGALLDDEFRINVITIDERPALFFRFVSYGTIWAACGGRVLARFRLDQALSIFKIPVDALDCSVYAIFI